MQEPSYRRYHAHEPDENQAPGAYDLARPDAAAMDTVRFHVPRFLSPAFLAFFAEFCANPMGNPVFGREWRRLARRWWMLSWLATRLHPALLVMCWLGLSALLAIAGMEALHARAVSSDALHTAAMVIYFAPTLVLALTGFLAGLRGCFLLWNRATLVQVAVTLLHPQEIAFGHLTGSVLPRLIPWLLVMPCLALVGFQFFVFGTTTINFTRWAFGAMVVTWAPYAAATLLLAGAISTALSYDEEDSGRGLLMPLALWVVFEGAITLGVVGPLMGRWSLGESALALFAVGVPLATLLKLGIAGAFVHHLAVRMARKAWAPG